MKWSWVIICLFIVVGCTQGTSQQSAAPPARQDVRLALGLQSSSALAIIAMENGYFANEGLDLTVSEHVSGKRALHAMLAGEADVATTAQVPMVFASFAREDFRTLATIGSLTNVERVVARRDRGIDQPSDLRGKRVATQKGSAVHFFLHVFLAKHALSEAEVTMSYLKGEQLPKALIADEIDAFSMREPYISHAVEGLGDNAVVFAAPGVYYRTEHLLATQTLLQRQPQAAAMLIRALLKAEDFARDHQQEAIKVVARKLGVQPDKLANRWSDFDLRVLLDQAMLSGLEDQARWAIDNQLVENHRKMPNYLRFIDTEALKTARPEAVTIIQ